MRLVYFTFFFSIYALRPKARGKAFTDLVRKHQIRTCLASALVTSPRINSKARAWSDLKSGYLLAIPWGKKVSKSYSFVLLPTRIPLSVTHLEFVFNLKYDLKGQGIQIRIFCKTLETNSFY